MEKQAIILSNSSYFVDQTLQLSSELLAAYRAQTFRLSPAPRIAAPEEALTWVNQRGFAYFWPIKGITLPSLWVAAAGDRPVGAHHDDPGHVTWGWKDAALGKRIWYYAKVLRRKATFISLDVAPYFYALSENYGSPEEDYLLAYEQGRLTMAAKQVYEALLKEGALHTIDLRKAARLTSKQSDVEFNRALEVLQADFKILPVGVAQAGSWNYAFIYAITARHFPELPEKAREIGEAEAREKLAALYFRSVGAAQLKDIVKLFGWGLEITLRVVKRLVDGGKLVGSLTLAGQAGEWIALPELVAR
jgi:hypothetical protein